MCGRFGVEFSYMEAARHYQALLGLEDPPAPRYNIAPRTRIPVLQLRDGSRVLGTACWGLIPVWAKDKAVGDRMINARAETVATTNSFRGPFKSHRAIVSASFFYEWQKRGAEKAPHVIKRVDGAPMSFAGLTAVWTDKETGEVIESATIITTAPNRVMAPLHNRMPVILPEDAIDEWLDAEADPASLQLMPQPCPDEWLTAYPVSKAVGNTRNQGPELIEPA
jgi:putative SOS response-associated peptidase YedK